MTELQYDFLCRYQAAGCPSPSGLSPVDRGHFKACREMKWIKQVMDERTYVRWTISELGLAAMLEYENVLKQEAESRARHEAEQAAQEQMTQKRWDRDTVRSWIQFWLNVLFSTLGFAAGIFVEHYFSILELLLALF